MLELIRRTAHSFGISMLLSTNLMGDIERTADRVILLENGRVSEEGALSEFTQETEDLLIEVDDREGVARALSGRGVRVIEEPQQLVVQNATDADYDAIRDAVADVGARLRRLTPRRHTLTEMFRRREE